MTTKLPTRYEFCDDIDIGVGMRRVDNGEFVTYSDYCWLVDKLYDTQHKYKDLVKELGYLVRDA